jgi:hypothetical protein
MASSFALYAFGMLALLGLMALVRPIRWLGIRNRWVALLALVVGYGGASHLLHATALASYVTTPATKLDEFAPIYQFSEAVSIPVRAPADRVYRAVFEVTADEVPFYRTLVWLRRGGAGGPESVLNPPDGEPLISVATRTSFLRLAEVPGREFVMGAVVMAPPGVRLASGSSPASFKALNQEGFAKATMNFMVEPQGPEWSLLRTETRVFATDPASRDVFARYWRVIAPGSAVIRLMWLRAIKVRAEATAR